MSANDEYSFPSIYNFPPMFTKQVNEQTWKSQLQYWTEIILGFCRFYNVMELGINGPTPSKPQELFSNQRINRALKPDTVKEIFKHMVESKTAEWLDDRKKSGDSSILVYLKTPDEWASLIKSYIDEAGLNNGAVVTVYELIESEESESQEFHGLHPAMVNRAISILSDRGQCLKMKGPDGKIMGLKFV